MFLVLQLITVSLLKRKQYNFNEDRQKLKNFNFFKLVL